jgi:hypothetical protein
MPSNNTLAQLIIKANGVAIPANAVTFAGTNLWRAGKHNPANTEPTDQADYPFALIDFWLSLTPYPGYFATSQVLGICDLLDAHIDSTTGAFPNFIVTDGTPHYVYFAGDTNAHGQPLGDSAWVRPMLERILFERTGDITHFVAAAPAMKSYLRSRPRNPNGSRLIWIDPAADPTDISTPSSAWRPMGFQDAAVKRGDDAWGNALCFTASSDMAKLYTAANDDVNAALFAADADAIKTGMIASLYDNSTGMLFSQSYNVGSVNHQIDIGATVYSAWAGILSPTQIQLAADWLHTNKASVFLPSGAVRQTIGRWNESRAGGQPYGADSYDNAGWYAWFYFAIWTLRAGGYTADADALVLAALAADSTLEWVLPPGGTGDQTRAKINNLCSICQVVGAAMLGLTPNVYTIVDAMAGSQGASLDTHTPGTGPQWGTAGKAPGTDIRLDGAGGTYNNASPGSLQLSSLLMTSADIQTVATWKFLSSIPANDAATLAVGVDLTAILASDASTVNRHGVRGVGSTGQYQWELVMDNGAAISQGPNPFPSAGTSVSLRETRAIAGSNRLTLIEASVDGEVNWAPLFSGPQTLASPHSAPNSIGLWYDDAAPKTATTGIHIGNLRAGNAPVSGPTLTAITVTALSGSDGISSAYFKQVPTPSTALTDNGVWATDTGTIDRVGRLTGVPAGQTAHVTYTVGTIVGTASYTAPVATPTYFPVSGSTITTSDTVEIDCATAGATVLYTTDGTTPTSASPVYSVPFTLAKGSKTIKALAVKAGAPDSAVATAIYTVKPIITGITVTPSSVNVFGGGARRFAATVNGSGNPSQSVTWTASAGSIDSTGLLTVPAAGSNPQTITVTATSVDDNTKHGTATVIVPAGASAAGSPRYLSGMVTVAGQDGVQIAKRTYMLGDAAPDLEAQFIDADGTPLDLTGYTVEFDMGPPGGSPSQAVVDRAAAILVYAARGFVTYSWAPGDLATPGTYRARFYATAPGGQTISSGVITVIVKDRFSN